MNATLNNAWAAHAKLAFVAFCWGSAMIAGRVIATDVPVLMAATIRLAIAAGVLLVLLRGQGPLPRVSRAELLAVRADLKLTTCAD